MASMSESLRGRRHDGVEPFAFTRAQVGMLGLIASESTFFLTFMVTYLFYVGHSLTPPYPNQVLELPLAGSVCLLSSSWTIARSLRGLRGGRPRDFLGWWLLTIGLGTAFLASTALEWHRLIVHEGLTIATNLFGTSFYSLVGLHAAHVAVGLVLLATVGALAARGHVRPDHHDRVELLSWYWHFVDAVWVVVLATVYGIGR